MAAGTKGQAAPQGVLIAKEHLAAFQTMLPPDAVTADPGELRHYGKDSCKEFASSAAVALFPRNENEVAEIVRYAARHRLPIVPSGGRTGYSGGATATQGEVVVSLERMRRIIDVDPVGMTLRCEAGATTENVQQAAARAGLYYPVDFASKGSSHIGGNLATNAGGIRVVRYGSTRDWVLGLRVVTGAGEVLDLNGALYKNQSGYDLRQLFVGSEGTLGVITEATLRLTVPRRASRTALFSVLDAGKAAEMLQQLRRDGLTVEVFEYFERDALELVVAHASLRDPMSQAYPAYLLLEVEDWPGVEAALVRCLELDLAKDAILAGSLEQAAQLFAYRELISESIARAATPHKNDISVPIPALPGFLVELRGMLAENYRDYRVVVFGHLGDGNLHINVLQPSNMPPEEFAEAVARLDGELFALVARHRGSISAEHGVGLLKKPYLRFSRAAGEVELMRGIKRLFDPAGVLNPGKVFDP